MTSKLILAVALLGTAAAYAQNPFSTEVKGNYDQAKGVITKAAEDMPEAGYSYVPGKGSRTYGAAVVHIADVQAAICGMASGGAAPKIDGAKTGKADAIVALKTAFDFCDPIYAALNDADAAKMVNMFGRPRTKLGVLDFGVIHDNEMYGTLAVYLRAQGTVPPSSAGRGKKKE